MRTRCLPPAAAVVGLVALTAPLAAQTTFHTHAAEITVGGRLHTQFNTSSADSEPASEFVIRRARVDAFVKINDFLSGFVQPEYAGSRAFLQVAYARLNFAPAFHAMIGQYKRPFDLFTQTGSADILVIERTGGIRGVGNCSGVSGMCSYGQFMEKLHLSTPDIGVILDVGDRAGRFSYAVAVMNGAGQNVPDENGTKSYTGRVVIAPSPDLHLGANLALHDYVEPTGANGYARVVGGDLELGNFTRGLHLQVGAVAGDNWLNYVAGGPSTFVTAQAIATYKFTVKHPPYAEAIEPLARVSWGNPDTATPQDGGLLVTPGIVWFVSGRNKFAANMGVWHPQQGVTELGLKVQPYLFF
jgi:hypothetical protein